MIRCKTPVLCILAAAVLSACGPVNSGSDRKTETAAKTQLKADASRTSTDASPRPDAGKPAQKTEPALPTMLGANGPVTMDDLPQGRFKSELAALPKDVQGTVLEKLAENKVPVNDLKSLHVFGNGVLYYKCPEPDRDDDLVSVARTASLTRNAFAAVKPSDANVPIAEPPVLHSRPGALNAIYLDFNGGVISGTIWEGGKSFTCLPLDTDDDATTFNPWEQALIIEIWECVSEDYAPFNIDVTTEEPKSFDSNRIAHVMITPTHDANGNENPHYGAAGIAVFGGFGTKDYATKYSPVFVASHKIMTEADTIFTANAASHEVGHNLGLNHDGTSAKEYYGGHSNGYLSWSPIMGSGTTRLTQWSKGEYYDADNNEDDLAMIAVEIGYEDDDIPDTIAGAKAITPEKGVYYATGIIGNADDVDLFKFTLNYRYADIMVSPMCVGGTAFGADGDLKYELRDANGSTVLQLSPVRMTSADSFSVEIEPGDYYLYVSCDSFGDPMNVTPTGYTKYGCIGNYYVRIAPTVGMPMTLKPVVGESATLTAKPFGKAPWTYVWKKGRSTLPCTDSQFAIPEVEYNDKGVYRVTATDADGVVSTGKTIVLPRLKHPKLRTWGNDKNNTLTVPSGLNDVLAISACPLYGMVLKADGTVALWGDYADNLGAMPPDLTDIVDISANDMRAMALKADGTLIMWGQDDYDECHIPYLDDPVAFTSGKYFSVALEASGDVVAWGNNGNKECTLPDNLSDVVAIDAGDYSTLALKSDGTLAAWGNNSYGQTDCPSGKNDFVAISMNAYFGMALKADGSVVTWGKGGKIPGPAKNFISIAVPKGTNYGDGSLGITTDGTVVSSASVGNAPDGLANVSALAASTWCMALYDDTSALTPFKPYDKLCGKWSNQWGWIDDTFYPWVYSYFYDDWMYVYDANKVSVDEGYWVAFLTGDSYGWGYVYPKGGWYCLTSDNVWHWLKFTDPLPKSTL
jgi:hypothetical protein